jgi:L-threonylcarbamoyladenylate synthase
MRRFAVSAEGPDPAAIAAAVEVLRAGGVVAFPTDTLYGLAVDPRNAEAVERLFALKARDRNVAVPLVSSDLEQAMMAGEFGPRERRVADVFWPGPLSVVVPARPVIARASRGGGRTIAIRVPAHAVARELAAAFGFCVTATSANTAGQPPAVSASAVALALPDVDLLLDGGHAPGGAPSTLVAFDNDGPVLLRAGVVAWDRVIKSLQ